MLVLDDIMTAAAKDPKIADLFTEGSHHRNLSVINLTQNIFPRGQNAVTQRRNTHYMVIFKSPMSQDQIKVLAGYIFPSRVSEFIDIYHQATDRRHGYLIVDGTQSCPEALRLRTYVNPNTEITRHSTLDHRRVNISSGVLQDSALEPARSYSSQVEKFKKIPSVHPELVGNMARYNGQQSPPSSPSYMGSEDWPSESCVDCGTLFKSPIYLH